MAWYYCAMDLPDLKTLEPAAIRTLRIQYLQLIEAHRKSAQPKDAPSYAECVMRKNACNEELRNREENITATGISTAQSKALAQKVKV